MKKTYSLVLGGGTAKGLAHIGVVKYLEENQIKIKEIAGTSMGSIIGAAYAIGLSYEEILPLAKDLKLIKLLDLNLRKGFISGGKISKLLYKIFGDKKIEETNIALKIVATDVISGEEYIFEKGSIVEAIRASINLPLLFPPYEIGNRLFFDGGLKANLPVLQLKGKNIIAVSVINADLTTEDSDIYRDILKKKNIFKFNYEVFNRFLAINMKTNEDLCLEIAKNKGKNITLISPNLSKYDYIDFDSVDEIVQVGYKEIKEIFL